MRDLVEIADAQSAEGKKVVWSGILHRELTFARDIQMDFSGPTSLRKESVPAGVRTDSSSCAWKDVKATVAAVLARLSVGMATWSGNNTKHTHTASSRDSRTMLYFPRLFPIFIFVTSLAMSHADMENSPAVPINSSDWKIVAVTSEQRGSEAHLAIDGDPSTYWHSTHGTSRLLPQSITIDLGAPREICGMIYLPRPDGGNGSIAEFDLHGSADGETWGEPMASGRFMVRRGASELRFAPVHGIRFVRLTAKTAINKSPHWASVAELIFLTPTVERPQVAFSLPVRKARVGRAVRFEDHTRIAPTAWKWTFPGGTPATSTERHPEVIYQNPGSYAVTLEATNANGASSVTREHFIEVTSDGPMAVWLDGRDNELLIGMGLIEAPWTVELWVCGDADPWRPTEVLLGAGQYAKIDRIDATPLVLEHGVPASPKAKLRAAKPLEPGWHHLALTCDGKETALFVNGREAARSASAHPLLPGALGHHANPATAFGGGLDEIRIWRAALDDKTLAEWMAREPGTDHPQRAALAAWWSFDEMDAEIAPNLVSNPPLHFHIRNGRLDFRGNAPLALPVAQDHPPLREAWRAGQARLLEAAVWRSEWPAIAGSRDVPLCKLRLVHTGQGSAGALTEIHLDGLDPALLESVSIHDDGPAIRPGESRRLISAHAIDPDAADNQILRLPPGTTPLTAGSRHFLVSGALRPAATPGASMSVGIGKIRVGDEEIQPRPDSHSREVTIHPDGTERPQILRVLNWNIWHGGRHLGPEGPRRVLDLIRAARPDVVTLQEAYGSQEMLAKELDMQLLTSSPDANLAILSRLPIKALPTRHSAFQSLLAEVTLPDERPLHLASWWLRYAAYADGTYFNPGGDTAKWIADDTRLSTADSQSIFEKDIVPNRRPGVPLVIGGDFNSCSHLDWTAAAARFHGGYGPVAFPTSLLMAENGYRDTFRERHPDETARPDGTFAVIYGHKQHARIDYIYQDGVRSLEADVIRTHPEIGFAWPSDHAACISVITIPAP